MKIYFSSLISLFFISTSSFASETGDIPNSLKDLWSVKRVTEESEKIIQLNQVHIKNGHLDSLTRDLNHFLNQNIHKYIEHHDVLGHKLSHTLSKVIFEIVLWDLIVEDILNQIPQSDSLVYKHINERTGSPVLLKKLLVYIGYKINKHYGPVLKGLIFEKIEQDVKPQLRQILKAHMFHQLESTLYRNLNLLNFYDLSNEMFQKSGIDYLFVNYMVMSLPIRKHQEYIKLLDKFSTYLSKMLSEPRAEEIILSIDVHSIPTDSEIVESSLEIIKNALPTDYETAFLNNSPKQEYF